MRHRLLFTMLLITAGCSAASAQQQEPVMTRSQLIPLEKIPPVQLSVRTNSDTTTPKRSLGNCSPIKEWYYDGMVIDYNSYGKVYRMPVDNMHCLVPDANKTAHMPIKKTQVPERMPNAFSRREMNKTGSRK